MSETLVYTIIESRLSAFWADRTPIKWEDSNIKISPGSPYIKPSIDGIATESKGLGCSRNTYLLTVRVFTKRDLGPKSNLQYCDIVINGFSNYTEGNLMAYPGRSHRIGNYKEWYIRDVLIEVEYDNYT